MATLGRRTTATSEQPTEASTPTSAGLSTAPCGAQPRPWRRPWPAGRTLAPRGNSTRTPISPIAPDARRSVSSVSSNGTTVSAPSGTGAPVMMRTAVPSDTALSGTCPRGHGPDDPQCARRALGRSLHARRLHGVPVHCGVVHRWNLEPAGYVLSKDLAQRFHYGLTLSIQHAEEAQYSLASVLDAEHLRVVMPLYVLSLLQQAVLRFPPVSTANLRA